MPLRIAIIGSGVSGLSALWALQQTDNEVHLFESLNDFGGHAQTAPWRNAQGGGTTNVDIAFTLFNKSTYREYSRAALQNKC